MVYGQLAVGIPEREVSAVNRFVVKLLVEFVYGDTFGLLSEFFSVSYNNKNKKMSQLLYLLVSVH